MANSIPDGSWPELVEMARKHQTSMPKGQAELLALKAQIKCHEAQPTSTVSEIKLIYARVLKNEAELLALKVRINAYRARVVHVASVIPRGVSHDTRHPHQCIEQQSSCPKLAILPLDDTKRPSILRPVLRSVYCFLCYWGYIIYTGGCLILKLYLVFPSITALAFVFIFLVCAKSFLPFFINLVYVSISEAFFYFILWVMRQALAHFPYISLMPPISPTSVVLASNAFSAISSLMAAPLGFSRTIAIANRQISEDLVKMPTAPLFNAHTQLTEAKRAAYILENIQMPKDDADKMNLAFYLEGLYVSDLAIQKWIHHWRSTTNFFTERNQANYDFSNETVPRIRGIMAKLALQVEMTQKIGHLLRPVTPLYRLFRWVLPKPSIYTIVDINHKHFQKTVDEALDVVLPLYSRLLRLCNTNLIKHHQSSTCEHSDKLADAVDTATRDILLGAIDVEGHQVWSLHVARANARSVCSWFANPVNMQCQRLDDVNKVYQDLQHLHKSSVYIREKLPNFWK